MLFTKSIFKVLDLSDKYRIFGKKKSHKTNSNARIMNDKLRLNAIL